MKYIYSMRKEESLALGGGGARPRRGCPLAQGRPGLAATCTVRRSEDTRLVSENAGAFYNRNIIRLSLKVALPWPKCQIDSTFADLRTFESDRVFSFSFFFFLSSCNSS